MDAKFEKSFYDRRVEIRLLKDDNRVFYDFHAELKTGKGPAVRTPSVRLEIAVVERLTPNDFIVATGFSASPPSAS